MSLKHVPVQVIHSIHDQKSFLQFLRDELLWDIPLNLKFDDLTFGWNPEEIGLSKADLRGSGISQLRPFKDEAQPWGIFFIHLNSPRLYITALRKIIRGLNPRKRQHANHPTWKPLHLLFVCTHDWKSYTFAHFDGDDPQSAKISSFGWEYQSDFIRTLCEFNLSQLRLPEDLNLFGEVDSDPWIKQWSAAFDVKKVANKFFEQYDAIFKGIKRLLCKQFGVSPKLYDKRQQEWTEKDEKEDEEVHLFVQNLVNRLLFLKFLEKRKWLDFNPNYLSELYTKAISEKKRFYRDYLFYVFFAGLNHRTFELKFEKDWKGVVGEQYHEDLIGVLPFLNGGLFEKSDPDDRIDVPNEVFKDLFDLFIRYNFTITEDSPLDVEVALNPSMLGQVFEKTVNSRKEKGAYYTPPNIVSFMCREALKNHLASNSTMGNSFAKIERLIDFHSPELLGSPDALEIYKALLNIKVLDPAVGSGAFIVGMLLEMVHVYKLIGQKLEENHPFLLSNNLAKPSEVYKLKKQIIQNNLFGVDIEAFAVNIARLRLWLSLSVDFPLELSTREEFIKACKERKIDPLPNLQYKIEQGNSLLAMYGGVSLEPHDWHYERKQGILAIMREMVQKKTEFFGESDFAQKKAKQREIDGLLRSLVTMEIDRLIKQTEQHTTQVDFFGKTAKEKKEQEELLKEVKKLREVKDKLLAMETLPPNFPVIWDVDFGDVLASGGFDVVIANPPYVRQEELKEIKEDLALHYPETYTGTADLYTYFYAKGIKLLKPGGSLSYISSNKFFRAGYGAKLREYLTETMTIQKLIDFGDLPVFEATTYPCVIVATKRDQRQPSTHPPHDGGLAQDDEVFQARTVASEEELERFEEVFRREAITMRQSDLSVEGWRIEDRQVLGLLEKIKKAGVTLEEYVQGKIYYGIKTGYNDAFVIDAETKAQLIKEDKKSAEVIKPFLRGRDIKRYATEGPNLFLIFTRRGIEIKRYPAIEGYLRQFKKGLTPGTDGGRKPGSYKWYEIQDAVDYWQEFDAEKIVVPGLMVVPTFTLEKSGGFINAPAGIIASGERFLLALLNSKVLWFFHRSLTITVQQDYLRIYLDSLGKLPIATPTDTQRRAIEERVEKILAAKNPSTSSRSKSNGTSLRVTNRDTSALEKEIDRIVYELYGLSEEEIKIIEAK